MGICFECGAVMAMSLENPPPRLSADQAARMEMTLGNESFCGGKVMRLTKRKVANYWVVKLQCLTCGSAHSGGALSRDAHPYWDTYPEWDTAIAERWQNDAQAGLRARQREVQESIRRKRELVSQDYSEWLANSPEWADLRKAVIQRAGFTCEACLEQPARQVHHLTYNYGRLPPAWELRAVCKACHSRLHAGWHDPEEVP